MGVAGERESYKMLSEIGRGGMARVHLAVREEGEFQRLVAVKRVLHAYDDARFKAMFRQEASIAGLLRHPNIVSVLDYGEDDEGAFLVMDFVRGLTLSELLRDAREAEQALPFEVVLRIAIGIARGLHAAHNAKDHHGRRLGLIHRDLSPANVMIGWDGSVALADFGIAKVDASSIETETGVLKGKRGYMAPEQFLEKALSAQSDLFAFGVCLWEMLTLERLYPPTDTRDSAWRIVNEPVPDILDWRRVDPEMEGLLFALLAKNPADRPADAAEAAASLERMLAERVTADVHLESVEAFLGRTSEARRRKNETRVRNALATLNETPDLADPSVAEPSRRGRSRRPIPAWAWLAFAALAAALVLAFGGWREEPEGARAQPPRARTTEPSARPAHDPPAPPTPVATPVEVPSEEPDIDPAPVERVAEMRRGRARARMRRVRPRPRQEGTGVAYDEW